MSGPLRAFRAWRASLHEADRLVAGDPAGSESPGLDHLLAAVRAPGTAAEMSGEAATVAAMAAERRRAVRRRGGRVWATMVAIGAAVALLIGGGTALAARNGFFAAPPVTSPSPRSTSHSPSPSPSPSPTSGPAPGPTSAPPDDWCVAWWTAEEGGHPMNGRDRKNLTAAAGGADKIAAYCAAAKPATTPTGKVKKSHKPKKSKGAQPADSVTVPTTPSH
jgi:hypothetical protein